MAHRAVAFPITADRARILEHPAHSATAQQGYINEGTRSIGILINLKGLRLAKIKAEESSG